MKKIILFLIIFLASIFIFPGKALASADLFLSPASGTYTAGNTFLISLKVNTGGQAINAASADLTFDKTKITISSIDTSSSIFTMWPEAPSYSNTNGTIHFSGGLPAPGYNGSSGTIFIIRFLAVSQGDASVSFNSGSKVLLSDGVGTDVFGSATGGVYSIIPAVSCSANPNPALTNQTVTFSPTITGGSGNYLYTWSNACTGTSSTCSNSFDSSGTKTANLEVDSDGIIVNTTCSVQVNWPGLSVSCASTPSEIANLNQTVTFASSVAGGSGTYSYVWSNACTGTSSTCENSFSSAGVKTATVTVTSGSSSSSTNCVVSVSQQCVDSTPCSCHCGTCPACPVSPACPTCTTQTPITICPKQPGSCPVYTCPNIICPICQPPLSCYQPEISFYDRIKGLLIHFSLWIILILLVIIWRLLKKIRKMEEIINNMKKNPNINKELDKVPNKTQSETLN